jgi:Zn-dependent protease
MARDPRASRLEDDPFANIDDSKPPIAGQPQHIRVVIQPGQANPFEPFLKGFFDVGGPQVIQPKGSFFHFSKRELKDLAMATFAFSFAISIVFHGGFWGMLKLPMGVLVISLISSMMFALAALGPAFILHELAHKFVARHYGCWAEFRADPRGLKIGILIALAVGFVFMAPGAVMVSGRIGPKENGIISVAGPATNITLFFIGMVGGGLLLSMFNHEILAQLVIFWMWGNAILGAFNMLPFGPLDGTKVKQWSEPIFWLFMAVTVALVVSVFNGYAFTLVAAIAGLPMI